MKYRAVLKDGVILTDDYENREIRLLVSNLQEDFRKIGIDYPVDVYNCDDKKVLTVVPVENGRTSSPGSAADTL